MIEPFLLEANARARETELAETAPLLEKIGLLKKLSDDAVTEGNFARAVAVDERTAALRRRVSELERQRGDRKVCAYARCVPLGAATDSIAASAGSRSRRSASAYSSR